MPEITDFDSLLLAAAAQSEPQRLLFVFVRTGLPDDHDEQQAQRFRAGQGGALLPVMYVDKEPGELTTFGDLAAESRQMGEDWQMVLVAALDGRNGRAPTSAQAEKTLEGMVKTIHAGGDLSHFLAFDRDGELVRFL